MVTVTENGSRRGIGELFRELRDETVCLLNQEVALAKTEMAEKASVLGRNTAYAGISAVVLFAGAIFLLYAVCNLTAVGLVRAGIASEHAAWLAPLVIGGVTAAVGYGLLQKALATLKEEPLSPQHTLASLEENKKWLQQKVG